jgi:protein-tyrosine-phosphatase
MLLRYATTRVGDVLFFPEPYKFLHWSFDDPAAATGSHEEKLGVFRRVRDEIAKRIDEELVAPQVARRVGT